MIERLIEFAVRRRAWILLAAVLWTVAGTVAVLSTPMDAVPDLSENQVLVYADWPAHSPEEVEQSVTYPLSLALQGLPGVRVVRASSEVGYALLHLIFEDNVSFNAARERVQQRLASAPAELPSGVIPRLAADGIPTGQIFWYTVEGGGFDLAELRALQDWTIAPQLRSVAGVAEVASVGGFVREIHVQFDLPRLAQAGLKLDDVSDAIAAAHATAGGHVIQKGNAEFVVQIQSLADGNSSNSDSQQRLRDLEALVVGTQSGTSVTLGELARVTWGAAARRGVFERDGNEVVGGVVHLRYGHNPLEVTRAVKSKLRELQTGLPGGVLIRPCYDRTPLILGAVNTVARTLIEAICVACVCVVLVLRHWRASLIVALTLPLAVLGAFNAMWALRILGVADVQANIMSIAGIVISIGVLVDSSVVLTENVMFQLRRHVGDQPVTGDVSAIVLRACQSVGRPVFFSILIMLVSFLPVFALSGIDGRMYAPLAWTKSLSLIASAILAVLFVPALCVSLVRGRIRDESESWIVRTVIQVYRPVLSLLLDRPGPLVWMLSATFILAMIAIGNRLLLLVVLSVALVITGLTFQSRRWRTAGVLSLIFMALAGESRMRPIGIELRLPLNEGMVMDMPITVPRASITQSGDDLKARDMVLCRFPEVHMVVGKAGRADTPFDPAPLDMIETMIEFRPQEWWPRRRLQQADALEHTWNVWHALIDAKLIEVPSDSANYASVVQAANDAGLLRYDAIQRETCHLQIQEFFRGLNAELAQVLIERLGHELQAGGLIDRMLTAGELAAAQQQLPAIRVSELSMGPTDELVESLSGQATRHWETRGLLHVPASTDREPSSPDAGRSASLSTTAATRVQRAVQTVYRRQWEQFIPRLNTVILRRAAPLWTRIVSEELIAQASVADERLADVLRQAYQARYAPPKPHHTAQSTHQHGMEAISKLPLIDPHPAFDELQRRLTEQFAKSLWLWPHDSESLAAFGGEMDRALQMPGWTNVWTKPIQNRVDMLTTGVNAEVGVRVLGRDLDAVVQASEDIAAALRELSGAADVVADPVRGKGYLRITPDPGRAAERGVSLGDVNAVIEASLAGRVIAHQRFGRERVAVRVQAKPVDAWDEQSVRRLPVPVSGPQRADSISAHDAQALPDEVSNPLINYVPLDEVASVAVAEGPATIKSENGWLRNYVWLNVRDRDPVAFVSEAQRVVAGQVTLPEGVFVEWTGQFEHSVQARRKLLILMPIVLGLIVLILFATYRDWADALLMVLAVPGALAGGVLCQWLLGYPFSIAVGMGYIACFGMAAATGIVMLVYLREAVENAGGLNRLTLHELRQAVLNGAVHRLRPKLLTEVTTVLGLAPMLWSTGVGAEVIRPMAAPVLGGILIADEVIDLLLPVLFYHVRRWRWERLNHSRGAGL